MNLTNFNMNLALFVNRSIPMLNFHPFVLIEVDMDAHINMDDNLSMGTEPQIELVALLL